MDKESYKKLLEKLCMLDWVTQWDLLLVIKSINIIKISMIKIQNKISFFICAK